ncbi:interferon-inducible GTPase 5-like isoform X1 [Alosa alosa]|nr:interferon-inducible GTPase 5-like isoform X1 [Alosa alosa]
MRASKQLFFVFSNGQATNVYTYRHQVVRKIQGPRTDFSHGNLSPITFDPWRESWICCDFAGDTDRRQAAYITMASPQPISEREISEMSSMLPSGVVSVVMGQVRGMLEQADSTTLDIAVTGEAGAGKSSFINAFRCLRDDDPGAAETGVTETTQKASAYAHPTAPNVRLWDLPGIGTPAFRPERYLEDVGLLRTYDFFIILASERFRECHAQLAGAISEAGKHFYFVRNKVDRELQANARRRGPQSRTDADVLQEIRTDCLENLRRTGLKEQKVFLISCFEPQSFDLVLLQTSLLDDLDGLKRRALLLSLPSHTSTLVEHKKQELGAELWRGVMSACLDGFTRGDAIGGAVPKLMDTLRDYQRNFGLDSASLHRLAAMTGTTYDDLCSEVRSSLGRELVSGTLERLLSQLGPAPQFLIRQLESRVPVLGSVVSGGLSFMAGYYLLSTALSELSQDAERVMLRALQATQLS